MNIILQLDNSFTVIVNDIKFHAIDLWDIILSGEFDAE